MINEKQHCNMTEKTQTNKHLLLNINSLHALFMENNVNKAYTFGSINTNRFTEKSDIDFLIEFKTDIEPLQRGENWWTLFYGLQDILKRDIDILTSDNITNPYLKNNIERTKQLIYG